MIAKRGTYYCGAFPISFECFSSNPQGNSPLLVGYENTHIEITENTGKYTFFLSVEEKFTGKFIFFHLSREQKNMFLYNN